MSKKLVGTVVSDKGDKTIVISIRTRKTHPIYRKQFTVTNKVMAHDEKNEASTGDKVEISETRPLSARKRHILSRIIEKPSIRQEDSVKKLTDDTPEPKVTSKSKKDKVESKDDSTRK